MMFLYGFLLVVIFNCYPSSLWGSIIHYTVEGKTSFINHWPYEENSIIGDMLVSGDGIYERYKDIWSGEDKIDSATYNILSFSFRIGSHYIFSGTGSIYMTSADNYLFLNGVGDWNEWVFDVTMDCGLIDFQLPTYFVYNNVYSDNINGLELRDNTSLNIQMVPVPEPASAFLLGASSIFIFGFRRMTVNSKKRSLNS